MDETQDQDNVTADSAPDGSRRGAKAELDPAEIDRRYRLNLMDGQASGGDLAGLLNVLIKQGLPALKDLRRLLRTAVDEASQKSACRFAREIYRENMAFLQYIQMRLHAYAVDRITAADRQSEGQLKTPPEELVNVMPQIQHLIHLSADLSQSWAQSMRFWRLATRGDRKRRKRRTDWSEPDRQHFEDQEPPEALRTDD